MLLTTPYSFYRIFHRAVPAFDDLFVHIDLCHNGIAVFDNFISVFFQNIESASGSGAGNGARQVTVVIEDSKPCSHAVRDFFHVFGIDFVALQFAHNILAECGIIRDSKEGRAQFQVCDILHHVFSSHRRGCIRHGRRFCRPGRRCPLENL